MAGEIANRKLAEALLALKEAGLVKYGVDENGDINVIYADTDGIQKFKGDLDIAGDFTIDLIANPGTDIGDVTARLATDYLKNGTTNLTPKFAVINAASGDNAIVAAVVGKKIRVLSYQAVLVSAATFRFEDGAAGSPLTGIMSFGDNGGISVPFSPLGHFETSANTALSLEVTGDADGHLTYVEV